MGAVELVEAVWVSVEVEVEVEAGAEDVETDAGTGGGGSILRGPKYRCRYRRIVASVKESTEKV